MPFFNWQLKDAGSASEHSIPLICQVKDFGSASGHSIPLICQVKDSGSASGHSISFISQCGGSASGHSIPFIVRWKVVVVPVGIQYHYKTLRSFGSDLDSKSSTAVPEGIQYHMYFEVDHLWCFQGKWGALEGGLVAQQVVYVVQPIVQSVVCLMS